MDAPPEHPSQAPASDSSTRDQLALERTRLANERTLLAYARTALALAGGGAAFIHLFTTAPPRLFGWTLIGTGLLTILLGAWRFLSVSRRLR